MAFLQSFFIFFVYLCFYQRTEPSRLKSCCKEFFIFFLFIYFWGKKKPKENRGFGLPGTVSFLILFSCNFSSTTTFQCKPLLVLFVVDSLRFGLKFISSLNYAERLKAELKESAQSLVVFIGYILHVFIPAKAARQAFIPLIWGGAGPCRLGNRRGDNPHALCHCYRSGSVDHVTWNPDGQILWQFIPPQKISNNQILFGRQPEFNLW